MPIRLLLDAHISPQVAYRLSALGYDVVPVRDRGLLHAEDWELMAWCIQHQSTMCTQNGKDFEEQHRRCQVRGEDHYGVLVVSGRWTQEQTAEALRLYLEAYADPPINRVVNLSAPPP